MSVNSWNVKSGKKFLGAKYKMAPTIRRKGAPRRRRFPRRKGAKRTHPVTLVARGLQPFSSRYICKMKYSETVTPPLAGLYQMNLNSIFDPNRTGGGHQPYGFDQLSTLYNKYRVISCGYRIQRAMLDTGNPVMVGALPSNDVSRTFSTFSELRENPRAKYITQNSGSDVKTLSGKVYLPSLMGRTRAQYMADDQYSSIVTTSPQEAAILYILTSDANDIPANYSVQVLLEFTVEFFDVKHVLQS